jgi:SAM-dependent methyltransferase
LQDLEEILNSLPRNAKVLDIGSGTGTLDELDSREEFGRSRNGAFGKYDRICQAKFSSIKFVEGISSALPFEESQFDLIIAFEVFRYLDKSENKKSFAEGVQSIKARRNVFFTQVNIICDGFLLSLLLLKEGSF